MLWCGRSLHFPRNACKPCTSFYSLVTGRRNKAGKITYGRTSWYTSVLAFVFSHGGCISVGAKCKEHQVVEIYPEFSTNACLVIMSWFLHIKSKQLLLVVPLTPPLSLWHHCINMSVHSRDLLLEFQPRLGEVRHISTRIAWNFCKGNEKLSAMNLNFCIVLYNRFSKALTLMYSDV